ncbi:MAG: LysR substrate-binding domain-containing protein [Kofleriaceae bacterium]
MPSPSLDELRAFAAVFETRGFTAAGRRLGVTTNAISLRVQRLEELLATRLFVRTTRSVSPTHEAHAYYERVAEALFALDEADRELRAGDGELRGAVSLAVPGVLATRPLLDRLRALLDAHPALSIQTRITNTPANLASEGLDVAIAVGQAPSSTFVGRRLGQVRWVLAASPSYLERYGRPRTPEALSAHHCIRLLASPPQREWTLVDRRGRQVTVPVSGPYEADDSRALGDATYAGLGIGVRPLGECARAARTGALERVLPRYHFEPLEIYALVAKGRLRVPRIAACLEAVRLALRELA